MPENPLLPNRRLQELHALMLRCNELDRKQRFAPGLAREAFLAATAIHMEPGDLLCGESEDATAASLADRSNPSRSKKKVEAAPKTPATSHLTFCAGLARALQIQANKGVLFAFTTADRSDLGWSEALRYAQEARLPLVLVCSDSTGDAPASVDSTSFNADEVAKLARRLRLPVVSVDGEDAVAMYRVMQESALRARTGDGPAVVWCSMTRGQRAKAGTSNPLVHMEQYLAARGLKPLKRST